MNEEEIGKWANDYIQAQQVKGLNTDHPLWWAIERFMHVGDKISVDDSLNTILSILEMDPPNKVLDVLAAGPLEDLIENHGEKIIDKIELLANRNPQFKKLLRGVWKSSTPKVWARIKECRK